VRARVDHFTRRGWGKRTCADACEVIADRLILADGCSSALNSDLGARLLVRAGGDVEQALEWTRAIGLEDDALDATCLTAQVDPTGVQVEVIGDGVVAAQRRDGTLAVWRIEYPSNAPAYPLLAVQPDRAAAWAACFGNTRRIHGPDGVTDLPGYTPWSRRFDRAEYDRVAVFSDGVTALEACVSTETGRHFEPVDAVDAVAQLMAIRHPKGAFVERRVRRLFDRTGWRARDDFAMGMWAWC
jgi:hypothetical protein